MEMRFLCQSSTVCLLESHRQIAPLQGNPDWIIKNCCLLLLAAVCEADTGVENLWKKGRSGGRHDCANFGQHAPINHFKAFMSAAPCVWGDKKFWCLPKRLKEHETFLPALRDMNAKRKELHDAFCLMLDESMVGWKPKTSKTGGLPNISSEPRKPCDLGAMFRNAVECITGVFVHHDVSQDPETQERKECHFTGDGVSRVRQSTSVPYKAEMEKHTAEVLRQVGNSDLKEGGWVGGDAWFGCVKSSVELMVRHKAHSTFVIKKHNKLFPMKELQAVLLARHGDRPAGHWVAFTTKTSGVDLMAVACAWSQSSMAHFITTCGGTKPHDEKCRSKFEDEWGNPSFKEIKRPSFAHVLHMYLPLIDEHNKQRQSVLALEKRWLTKDCWFRLMTSSFGMCVVDVHRHCRHDQVRLHHHPFDDVDSVRVIKFSDMTCGGLRKWKQKRLGRNAGTESQAGNIEGATLERIRNKDGETNREPTAKQIQKGRTVGNAIQENCYICRRFLNSDGSVNCRTSSFWCSKCHMPLCNKDRSQEDFWRETSCLNYHLDSRDPDFACGAMRTLKQQVPENKRINPHAAGAGNKVPMAAE